MDFTKVVNPTSEPIPVAIQSGSVTVTATPGPTTGLTEATIDFTSTGDNTVVAGSGSLVTKVYRLFFTVSTATTVTFKQGATSLTGAMTLSAGGAVVLDLTGDPWFTSSAGQGFIISQTGTAQISGRVYYTQL